MTRSLSWVGRRLVFNQGIYEGWNHLCTRRPRRVTHPSENANYHVDLQQTVCNYITACREALRNPLPIAEVMRR